MRLWDTCLAHFRRRHGATVGSRDRTVDWRHTFKARVLVVAGGLIVWVTGIGVRLVYVQIVHHADYVARADKQHDREQDTPAKRGDIVDRMAQVLATSVDADTIYAVPSEIGDPEKAAGKLCTALEDCTNKERQTLTERLRRRGAFTYVRRQVSPDQRRRVEALSLDGVGFVKESKRFYPNKELAAHLLGYVGIDNVGLNGIEAAYDSQIRGKSGRLLVQTDARRQAFSRVERPPTSGATVELTIDEYLQHIAERELHAGVVANNALAGSAIIMNPRTGEILAMANEPTFNPNAYRDFGEAARRNRAVQDLYEPGSTFKIVTVSAALEEKVMGPGTMIDTNPGAIRLGSRIVTEAKQHNYGVLSLRDVIVRSSNVGAIKIGFKVGTDRLSRYVQRFGFGHPTSPDFPGESPGIVWDAAKWSDSALMSVSMGYQIGVTPLQMATAVSGVANGGEIVEPRVIRAIYRDGRRIAVKSKVVRRAITQETAATLVGIMEGVVDDPHGTAKAARISGYTIAGKTGTANKPLNGRYTSDTFASFAGFIPSRNPAVTILVMLDSARGNSGHFGGAVSAPIFKRIAEATVQYLGIPHSVDPEEPVLAAHPDTAILASLSPSADTPVNVAPTPPGTLPDLRGMSARAATLKLAQLGLIVRMAGDGFVVSQDPPAGTALEVVGVCRLVLDRSPARLLARATPQ